MKITEVKYRPETLIQQLLSVWESSVKATHLFLSEKKIADIRQYVPQALTEVQRLLIIETETHIPVGFLELITSIWKCSLLLTKKEAKDMEKNYLAMELKITQLMISPLMNKIPWLRDFMNSLDLKRIKEQTMMGKEIHTHYCIWNVKKVTTQKSGYFFDLYIFNFYNF